MQRIKPHIAPWFAVVVVGLLLGGGWYLDARGRGQDAAELEARLRRLEQAQLKSVDEAPWGGREPVSRPPAASASPGAGAAFGRPPLPPPLSPQERQRLQRQAVSRLESRFATDGSDPQWAASTDALRENPRKMEVLRLRPCFPAPLRMTGFFGAVAESDAEDGTTLLPCEVQNTL